MPLVLVRQVVKVKSNFLFGDLQSLNCVIVNFLRLMKMGHGVSWCMETKSEIMFLTLRRLMDEPDGDIEFWS